MMIIMENDLKKETTKLKSYIYIIIDIYNFIQILMNEKK